ncbi:MAG: hypothetical protein HC908_17905, partial [Calothrix sp. SM1_7_51]|nr:hypothetical protein [Calothrix sp. SM1_7_51]
AANCKNNDVARQVSLSQQLSMPSVVVDKSIRDIFGRDMANVQNVRDQQNFLNRQRFMDIYQSERNRYNQSLLGAEQFGRDSQLQSRQLQNVRDIASIQANAQLGAAAFGAQGNILSSLFGSINSGTPSYKFWN